MTKGSTDRYARIIRAFVFLRLIKNKTMRNILSYTLFISLLISGCSTGP